MCTVPTCARIQSCSTSLLTIQQRICSRNLSNCYLLCYPVLFHTRAGQRQCGPRGTSDTLRAWLVGTICTRTIIANRTKYSFRTIMFQWNTATEVTLLLAFGLLQMQILDDTPWLPLAESVDEDHAQCTSGCNSDDIEISPDASTPWTRKYCKSSACTHRRFSQPRTEERERTSIYLLPGRDRFATQLNQHTKHKFAKCTPDSPVNNSVHQDHLVKNKLHTRITSSRRFIGAEKWRLAIIFLLIFTHLPCGSLSPVSNYIPMMNVEDSAPTEPDSDDYHTAAQHLKDISEFRPPSEELPCRYRFREDVETSALLADYVVVGWPVKAYTEPYNPLYNVSLFVTAVLKSQPQTVFPIREQHLVRVGQFSKIPDPGRCWIDVQKDTMYIFFIKQPNWAGFCEISQLPVVFSLDALSKVQNILKLGSYPLQMRPLHHADRLQVDEGNDVLLSCRVRGRPTPLISWFFNRIEIKTPWKPGSERGIVQASRYLSKLQLGKVRPSDSGNYTCLAENLNGHIRKSVQIIVQPKTTPSPITESTTASTTVVTVHPCHKYCYRGQCFMDDGKPYCSCISQYHGARCDIYSPLKSIPDPKLTDRQKDDLFGCKNGCDSPPGRVILISAVGALLVTLFLFLMCFISQACYKKQRAHKTSASIISHDFQNQGFQACRTQLHNSECPAGYANVANLEGITPSSHCFALMHQNTENLLKVDENRSVSLSSPSKVVDIHLPSPQPIRPCLSPRYGADEQRVEKYPSVPSLFNYFLTDVGRFNTPVQMSRRSVSLKSLPRDPQPSEQSHTHEGSAGNSHNCHPKPEAQYRQNNYARSRSTACNVYSKRDNFFLSSNQSSSCTVTHPLDTINDDNRYFILDTCPLVMQPMPDLVYQNQCLDWNNTYKYPNSLQINTVQRFAHQQYSQPNDPKVSPCHFDIIRQSDPIYEPETASNVQTFLRYNTVQGLPQTKSRNLKYVQVQSARRLRC